MTFGLTNHAICRYVERVRGIDLPACSFSDRDCKAQVARFEAMGLDLAGLRGEIVPDTEKNRISFELSRGGDKVRVETMLGDVITLAGRWREGHFVVQTIYPEEREHNYKQRIQNQGKPRQVARLRAVFKNRSK